MGARARGNTRASIHRAINRNAKGELKATKTNTPRRIPLEPALRPLLEAMKAKGGDRIIVMPPLFELARRLRRYLSWAGVKRAELFADDATRKQLRFYDLRATGITWMAIRGDDPLRIKQRAGHKSFSTTERYIRAAEDLGAKIGEPFPTLPAGLIRHADSSESYSDWAKLTDIAWKKVASPAGFEPALVP